MDIINREHRNADVALYDANRELESQRLEFYQANQWADEAQREKLNLCGELEVKNCLCLTIHIATALHLFSSACTPDVTSTVMTRVHLRSSMRAHSPLSGSSVKESCAQDTEPIHGKHGSGALLGSFPLLFVVVLVEHVGCLSSGDRDRGLRIWNECEARRNE